MGPIEKLRKRGVDLSRAAARRRDLTPHLATLSGWQRGTRCRFSMPSMATFTASLLGLVNACVLSHVPEQNILRAVTEAPLQGVRASRLGPPHRNKRRHDGRAEDDGGALGRRTVFRDAAGALETLRAI